MVIKAYIKESFNSLVDNIITAINKAFKDTKKSYYIMNTRDSIALKSLNTEQKIKIIFKQISFNYNLKFISLKKIEIY